MLYLTHLNKTNERLITLKGFTIFSGNNIFKSGIFAGWLFHLKTRYSIDNVGKTYASGMLTLFESGYVLNNILWKVSVGKLYRFWENCENAFQFCVFILMGIRIMEWVLSTPSGAPRANARSYILPTLPHEQNPNDAHENLSPVFLLTLNLIWKTPINVCFCCSFFFFSFLFFFFGGGGKKWIITMAYIVRQ